MKDIDTQVQKAQRVPNKMDAKRPTPRHVIMKMPKFKDKENLQSSKRKEVSYLQGSSHKTVSCFLNRNFAGKKGLARNIRSHDKQGPTAKSALPIKVVI